MDLYPKRGIRESVTWAGSSAAVREITGFVVRFEVVDLD